MKKIIKIGMCSITAILVFILFSITSLQATWWNGEWTYKQQINISTPSGTTPQNYSVNIKLNSSNVGPGFNWNNECSTNATRSRIINTNETQEIDFWIKSCSQIDKTMDIWVKSKQNLSTTPTQLYLYYSNPSASLQKGTTDVFDLYFNFSELTMISESSGSNQDVSGNGDVLQGGRVFHTWGNSWKVFTDFGTFDINNDGSQIMEMDVKSSNCGEILGFQADTDATQENTGAYRWCGSQSSWGDLADNPYLESGNWEDVSTIFNDAAMSMTHLHMPIDDDIDANGEYYARDARIRKYVPNEPTFTLGNQKIVGTLVTNISPKNNFKTKNNTVLFSCSALTTNESSLTSMTLYGNWSGGWHANETKNISGNDDTATFTKNLSGPLSTYSWNCEVKGTSNETDFGDYNHTLVIDNQKPTITLNSPIGTINDVTPRINLSMSEQIDTLTYSINNQPNITLCTQCTQSSDSFLHLEEGEHTLKIYGNDTVGNLNSYSETFTIDMKKNYYDSFNDNSSIDIFNISYWGGENISFSGSKAQKFQGIELGYDKGNLEFTANQWGGGSNTGEVDITCPGGDANCWFTTQNTMNLTSLTPIQNGVAVEDGDSTTQGFIMYSQESVFTRFSSTPPNSQNAEYFIGVCYNSGQWFYDDNNACDNPFTPVSTDILIANVTWGITSVSPLNNYNLAGDTQLTSKEINLSQNISSITKIKWNEINTDAQNTIKVEISLDNGNTWYNVSSGGSLNSSTGNSLKYRVLFSTNGTKTIGLDDMNISWEYSDEPKIQLLSPTENEKIITSNPINFIWTIDDTDPSLNSTLYLNSKENKTINCPTNTNCSTTVSFKPGKYTWKIHTIDSQGNAVNSSSRNFTIIKNISASISKQITSNNGSGIYDIKIKLENKGSSTSQIISDFVQSYFNFGSFSQVFNFSSLLSTPKFNGTLLHWNITLPQNSNKNINYSITRNSPHSQLIDEFIVGLE